MPMWTSATVVKERRLHSEVTSSDRVFAVQSEQQIRANWQQAHIARDIPAQRVLRLVHCPSRCCSFEVFLRFDIE
jgi:hypothetical protein